MNVPVDGAKSKASSERFERPAQHSATCWHAGALEDYSNAGGHKALQWIIGKTSNGFTMLRASEATIGRSPFCHRSSSVGMATARVWAF